MLKFQPPMFNNEDFRAMTGKQTYKLSKKTEETFFTAKFKKNIFSIILSLIV